MNDSQVIQWRETGRRIFHSEHCGACKGKGCPEIELITIQTEGSNEH